MALVAGGLLVLGGTGAGIGVAIARSDDGPSPSRAATDRPCGRAYVTLLPSVPALGRPRLVLRALASADQPTALAFAPDGSGLGLLAERAGRLRLVRDGRVTDEVVLDVSDETEAEGDAGLLNLAYSPDGEWLYVQRTVPSDDNNDVVTAYPLTDGIPDEDGEVVILTLEHGPSEQHHGGGFVMGPDGYLYIGTGDGGGLGDPRGRGQDPGVLLGKMLRIEPTPEGPEPYVVPADNPFVGRAGWRPEIWMLGLRNPFRISFDTATGDLWVADVGQSCWEEIDVLPAATGRGRGANLGWDRREGTHPFERDTPLTGGGAAVEPVQTYAHRGGWCALVGGYVVRGDALPGLEGWYLHTDYCRGRIVAFHPGGDGQPAAVMELGPRLDHPVAIVAGPSGEPWVLTLSGEVLQGSVG